MEDLEELCACTKLELANSDLHENIDSTNKRFSITLLTFDIHVD